MSWTAPSGHVYVTGENVSAATLNTYVANNLTFLYGDTAWTAPTYANSWVDFGGSLQTVGFRLVGTRVVMRGTMKSGTINATAFTLPTGYRPGAQVIFACNANNAFGQLFVTSAGAVTPFSGSNLSFSLDTVAFDTI